jgi:hypothetical protein
MSDMTTTTGARRCQLSAVIEQACGCVVDFGVISDGFATGNAPMRMWRVLFPPKPKYFKRCRNDPRHVSIEERARLAAMQKGQ